MNTSRANLKVGFVGLGHMSGAMAARLLEAGHDVTVYNRTPEKAQPLVACGARRADSIEEACRGAAVVTMLADDDAVENIVLGKGGVLLSLGERTLHISMRTISAAMCERLAGTHAAAGRRFVAAPVFGRPDAAAKGELFIVAAGNADDLHACMPLFEAMGQKTVVIGEAPPAANLVKLSGNFLLAAVMEALIS